MCTPDNYRRCQVKSQGKICEMPVSCVGCAFRFLLLLPPDIKNAQERFSSTFLSIFLRRSDGIRTHDLCVPNAALYQTEPRFDCCHISKNHYIRISRKCQHPFSKNGGAEALPAAPPIPRCKSFLISSPDIRPHTAGQRPVRPNGWKNRHPHVRMPFRDPVPYRHGR